MTVKNPRGGFTARQVVDALTADGFTALWWNTGGGVMNVSVPVKSDPEGDVFCSVGISAWGGWGFSDLDNGSTSDSVCIYLEDSVDMFYVDAWAPEGTPTADDSYAVAYSVDSVVALVREAFIHGKGEGE